jgi:hypothetical protein
LEEMAGVEDRELVLERAVLAQDEPTAFLYQIQAELLAGYHRNVAPAKRLVTLASNVFLQREDGVVVGVFPADYVIWRERSTGTLAAMNEDLGKISGAHDPELWLTGSASSLCRDHITKGGWKVQEDARDRLRCRDASHAYHPEIGQLSDWESAFYFSMATITCVGCGDLVLSSPWRVLASREAANGLILFGWTTALLFYYIQRIFARA